MNYPPNWNVGFQHPLSLGRDEEPFQIHGRWYLYVWKEDANGRRDWVVYDYSNDMTIEYFEFQDMVLKSATPIR